MKLIFQTMLMLIVVSIVGCNERATNVTENTPPQKSGSGELPVELVSSLAIEVESSVQAFERSRSSADSPSPSSNDYDIYVVAYLWGNLFNLPGPAVLTDWSGTLSFNGEAVISVARTIDFEGGEDSTYITNNPAVSAWTSATGDPDGIVFYVAVKRGVTYIIEPNVTYTTQLVGFDIPMNQLESFAALYTTDSLNFVAVISRKIDRHVCARGSLAGEWVRSSVSGESGTLAGVWLSEPNDQHGAFAGTFWTNNDGTREFEATVTDVLTGVVIGMMRGTWLYDDPRMCPTCGQSHGRFSGKLFYENSSAVGEVSGEFGDYSLPPEQNNLPLKGEWRVYCPHVTSASPAMQNN